MAGELIYAFRVMRLPLLDAGGSTIGRLEDIVVIPGAGGSPPRVLGFVATSQRRRIFVNANRLGTLDSDGARLRSWDVDLKPFKPHRGEILIGRDLIDRASATRPSATSPCAPTARVARRGGNRPRSASSKRSALRRRPSYRLVDFDEVPDLFAGVAGAEMAAEAARLRDMHPSDVAGLVRAMPLTQRRQLAEAMDDERLADLLEELPEAEQLRIIDGLDIERLINVLDEMEYDDLADLLAEMPGEQRDRILDAMDAEDADVMRRLLSYEDGTAGALMTPEIIILGPTATVADALAEIRDPDWLVSIAAQVFVVQPPFKPPTGTYLGVVHFQRLLREPPHRTLGECLEQEPTIPPDLPERDVAERLASYNMLAVGVTDEAEPPARGDHRRRRPRPHPAHRLAPAPPGGGLHRQRAARRRRRQVDVKRHEDLTTPRRRTRLGFRYDPEAFGRFAEAIARTLGTARFLVFQTVFVVLWILLNIALMTWKWDPYPFILLNLAFSTQAAYAAPLILLAQNRQENRDRVQAETDRRTAERTQDDTEFLAREMAGVRRALTNVVTTEDIDDHVERLAAALDRIGERLDRLERSTATT